MSKRFAPSSSLSANSAKRQSHESAGTPVEESTQPQDFVETQNEMDFFDEMNNTDSDEDEDVENGPAEEREEEKMPCEAGIIDKIVCENFMNHQKLTVQFCKNINFIHGQNGSGKSAILAALQICLGARASTTHRGENLGVLVRRNKEGGHTFTAKVQVTLLNGGPDAFEPHKYGKKITIERTFNHASNSYKLYDAKMKFVSNKRRDLDMMLDRLNVQVDNPVCIMDQENSKEFIKGTAHDKYKFYSRATDLKRVVTNLQESTSELKIMDDVFTTTHARLADYATDLKQAQEDLDQLKEVEKIDLQIKKHSCMLFWIDVKDKEDALETTEDQQEMLLKKKEERSKLLEKAKADHASRKTSDELLAEMERLKSDSEEATRNVERLNKECGSAKKPVTQCEREIQDIKRKMNEHLADIKRVDKLIREAKIENSKNSGAEAQKMQAELEKLQGEDSRNEEELHRLRSTLDQLETDSRQAEDMFKQCGRDSRQIHHEVQEAEKVVQSLRQAQDVPATQFGSKVPQILKSIQQQSRRFKQLPIGPLGSFVKLREHVGAGGPNKWGAAVTQVLGGAASAFTCDNFDDCKVLQSILKDHNAFGQHRIHVLRYRPRYTNVARPNFQGAFTAENAIQVDNDIAYNALIENTGMESKCLFDTIIEAEKACFEGVGGHQRLPNNVQGCYDVVGDFTSLRNGNKFWQSAPRRGNIVSFGVDVEAQLIEANKEVAMAKQREREVNEHLRAKKADSQKSRQILGEVEKKINLLDGNNKRKLDQRISSLRSSLADLQTDTGVDTTEWEDDVKKTRANIQEHETTLNEIRKRKAEAESALEDKTTEKEMFVKTSLDLSKRMVLEEEKLTGLIKDQTRAQQAVEKAEKKLADCITAIQQKEEQAEKELGIVEKAKDAARKYTTENLGSNEVMPMPVQMSDEQVKAKITSFSRIKAQKLASLKPGQQDMDEAIKRATKARQLYDEKMADVKRVEENKNLLQDDLKYRLQRWKRFRKTISNFTTKKFDETLNRKGQCGHIDFNHKREELHITVQKDNRDSQSQIENVKLLSGGERSYATLSLLVALGEAVECPFRVMDEFDVFMDAVSRKIALDQLIEEGLNHKHRQFVFITPQDLSSITPTNEIKIIKLKNPSKNIEGQTTLTD